MENLQPAYYAVIPAQVRYDKRLKPNEKLLYGEITSLLNKTGECWASNEYFANLFDVDHKTISRWISRLNDFEYFHVQLFKSDGNKRIITIDKKVTTYTQNNHYLVTKKSLPSDEKVTSIYDNNKINNKTNREIVSLSFLEKNYQIQYDEFLLKYKSKISDFNDFRIKFDLTLCEEYFDETKRNPFSRLEKFTLSWIENQNKTKSFQNNNTPAKDPYSHLKAK